MERTFRRRVAVATLVTATITAVLIAVFGRSAVLDAEYLDCPFQKMPADTPRIIPIAERPCAEDKEAIARYQAERKQVWEYVKAEGCERDVTEEERKALDALAAGDYIRARDAAEKILHSNPDSLPGMYVRAAALVDGESNPAAALNQLRRFRHILHARGKSDSTDAQAREWYLRGLQYEYYVLTALGRDPEALRVVEIMEQLYQPVPWRKTWPLLRQLRFADAQATIEAAEHAGGWPMASLNSRGSLEFQLRQTHKSLESFRRLTALCPNDATYWGNCGEAAWCDLQFDEAETCYLNAVKYEGTQELRTAYLLLARLYVQEGRFSEAADALKKGRVRRGQRAPYTWQFDAGDFDLTLSRLLLALGKLDDAERITRHAYQRPNRQGGSTQTEASRDLSTYLSLWTLLRCRLAQLNEANTSVLPALFDRVQRPLVLESWALERKILKLLDDSLLLDTLRPCVAGNDGVEPWLAVGLMDILPSGVASAALERVRGKEDRTAAHAYFDAFESELALRSSRFDAAAQLADRALEKLPGEAEKLFRARVQTVAAAAAFSLGRTGAGLMLLDGSLDTFPAALRLLDVAVPVCLENDGSEAARALADRLTRSPRLRVEPNGFKVHVACTEGKLAVEMFRLSAARHFAVELKMETDQLDAAVTAAYQQFHERLASPAIDLTQVAINDLDGSPVAATQRNSVASIIDSITSK